MADFKRLSDVEVVEAVSDAANVLIEEDGIIKRAPKTEVGGAGGGGETPDMVITLNSKSNIFIQSSNFIITEGSVDTVFSAVRNGRMPIVKIRYMPTDTTGYMVQAEEYRGNVSLYGESLWVKYISVDSTSNGSAMLIHSLYINSDGSLSSHGIYQLNGNYYE